MATKRVLTGIRPTGPLHLGHKVGALDNWVDIQNEGAYDCYFLIADIQALTTHSHKPHLIESSVREVLLDWIAVGLDPENPHVHFVLQSGVVERYELSMLLQMTTPYSWIARNPTIKAEMDMLQDEMVVGFPSYPVDQAADILMVANVPKHPDDELLVPVGEDQLPHLELMRDISRRFNHMFDVDLLPECKGLVGEVGRLVGTDGKAKMSKSLGNTIYISDDADTVTTKVNAMYTDPNKIRVTDRGNVEDHVPFMYLRVFHKDQEQVDELQRDYENGRVGDVPVKKLLVKTLNEMLDPIRECRDKASKSGALREILVEGTRHAQSLTRDVTNRVRDAMHLRYQDL